MIYYFDDSIRAPLSLEFEFYKPKVDASGSHVLKVGRTDKSGRRAIQNETLFVSVKNSHFSLILIETLTNGLTVARVQ
jgi:hypothetical protein